MYMYCISEWSRQFWVRRKTMSDLRKRNVETEADVSSDKLTASGTESDHVSEFWRFMYKLVGNFSPIQLQYNIVY